MPPEKKDDAYLWDMLDAGGNGGLRWRFEPTLPHSSTFLLFYLTTLSPD